MRRRRQIYSVLTALATALFVASVGHAEWTDAVFSNAAAWGASGEVQFGEESFFTLVGTNVVTNVVLLGRALALYELAAGCEERAAAVDVNLFSDEDFASFRDDKEVYFLTDQDRVLVAVKKFIRENLNSFVCVTNLSGGNLDDWFSAKETNWTWSRDFSVWESKTNYVDSFPMWSVSNLYSHLDLPYDVVTNVVTNLQVEGWTVGEYTRKYVTITSSVSVVTNGYLDYTPTWPMPRVNTNVWVIRTGATNAVTNAVLFCGGTTNLVGTDGDTFTLYCTNEYIAVGGHGQEYRSVNVARRMLNEMYLTVGDADALVSSVDYTNFYAGLEGVYPTTRVYSVNADLSVDVCFDLYDYFNDHSTNYFDYGTHSSSAVGADVAYAFAEEQSPRVYHIRDTSIYNWGISNCTDYTTIEVHEHLGCSDGTYSFTYECSGDDEFDIIWIGGSDTREIINSWDACDTNRPWTNVALITSYEYQGIQYPYKETYTNYSDKICYGNNNLDVGASYSYVAFDFPWMATRYATSVLSDVDFYYAGNWTTNWQQEAWLSDTLSTNGLASYAGDAGMVLTNNAAYNAVYFVDHFNPPAIYVGTIPFGEQTEDVKMKWGVNKTKMKALYEWEFRYGE
jgi:hypothetical protein